jgi:hypothetical protein
MDVLRLFAGQRYSSAETEDGTFVVVDMHTVLWPHYATRAEADKAAARLNHSE